MIYQLIGVKIFPSKNAISTSTNPARAKTHFKIPSAKLMHATKATRFAIMFKINIIAWEAPLLAASRMDESGLKIQVKIHF